MFLIPPLSSLLVSLAFFLWVDHIYWPSQQFVYTPRKANDLPQCRNTFHFSLSSTPVGFFLYFGCVCFQFLIHSFGLFASSAIDFDTFIAVWFSQQISKQARNWHTQFTFPFNNVGDDKCSCCFRMWVTGWSESNRARDKTKKRGYWSWYETILFW